MLHQQAILFGLLSQEGAATPAADTAASTTAPATDATKSVPAATETTAVAGTDAGAATVAVTASDQAPAAGDDAAQTPAPWTNLLIIGGAMVLFFWLMMIRPQKKEQQKRQLMFQSIKSGDQVMTTAGIYGTVVEVNRDGKRPTAVIRIDEKTNAKMRISLYGIMELFDGNGSGDKSDKSDVK
ncbi:MAG: preprotein translocase subunit YajC [Thermoguttaceae bacterium]|nr:preprotein translocase subunit YajC [Thermoguttaceae bacterium]